MLFPRLVLLLPFPQLFYLEEQRRLRLQQLATLIQKTFRGWRCRTHYQLMRKSQILISAWFRGNMVQWPSPTHIPHFFLWRAIPLTSAGVGRWEAGRQWQG